MNCKKVKENLIFLAEGKLDPELSGALHLHLQTCRSCSYVYDELKETLAIIETEKQVKVDPWFAGRVEQQFNNMQEQGMAKARSLNPAIRFIRVIPLAASLAIALWLGILIGSELTDRMATQSAFEEPINSFYEDLVAEDIYYGSLETFFLTNGDD